MTPETTLGGPVIAEVYPGTEHVEIQLSSGKSFPDDSMPQGPAFDLRGCFSTAEATDGSSSIQLDGREGLRPEGHTGVDAGFLYAPKGGDETWYDLSGPVAAPSKLHARLEV